MYAPQGANVEYRDRLIKVFVSSTFLDMAEDRDELVKHVFPRLRKTCEERAVVFQEVDLRWGITDEQRAEGQVLPICLEEIRRCRPFFIGLLGERYGWVPGAMPPALVEREPWLSTCAESSVTEIEMVHGVLDNPEMAGHAFFYLRDPAYLDRIPESERFRYEEAPSPRESVESDVVELERRIAQRRNRLKQLKNRIRASGVPVREGYAGPRELGRLVFEDLSGIIDDLFPAEAAIDNLEAERAAHDFVCRRNARSYVSRPEYESLLDEHVGLGKGALLVTGAAGSGKSTLLSAWSMAFAARHPDVRVLVHVVGATPQSASVESMLHRLATELECSESPGLPLRERGPTTVHDLKASLIGALVDAATRGPIVVVVDAVDNLRQALHSFELSWLPESLPPGVSIVLSASAERTATVADARGIPKVALEPLNDGERTAIVAAYLAQYSKRLPEADVETIASTEQTGNALFLRTVLDELRTYGDHATLAFRLSDLLEATEPAELFEQVLSRYETDYERDRPGLVGECFSLIAAARRGLTEGELLDLLGDADPLPRAILSPLYLAADSFLVGHQGPLTFAHDTFRQAVEQRYSVRDEARRALHGRLAEYFATRPLGPRALEEHPWQLAEACDWGQLFALLADLPFFVEAWRHDDDDVAAMWARLEHSSTFRMVDAYAPVLGNPAGHVEAAWGVASLLEDAGYLRESLSLFAALAAIAEAEADAGAIVSACGHAGALLARVGELDAALQHFATQETMAESIPDPSRVREAQFNRATALVAKGEHQAADDVYAHLIDEWTEANDYARLTSALGNRAATRLSLGDPETALELYRQQTSLAEAAGDPRSRALALDGQAAVLILRGKVEEAMRLLEEEERTCREYGDREGLAICMTNRAVALRSRGDLAAAIGLLGEAIGMARDVGARRRVCQMLGTLGATLLEAGDNVRALNLLEEQADIARELGLLDEIQMSLGNQAMVFRATGELDRALRAQDEKIDLCRRTGNRRSLAIALGNKGNLLRDMGQPIEALALYGEKERIDRELGNLSGIAHVLGNRAMLHAELDESEAAVSALEEQAGLLRDLGDHRRLAHSLLLRAKVLVQAFGRLNDALPLAEEALAAARLGQAQDLEAQASAVCDALRASLGR